MCVCGDECGDTNKGVGGEYGGGWWCLCGVGDTRGSCVCVCTWVVVMMVVVVREGGRVVWCVCVVAVVGGYVGDGAVVVMVCEHGWVCDWLVGCWHDVWVGGCCCDVVV